MAIYRRFRVQQKYVNGQPTEEYRLGVEVDGTNYHSLEACQSGSECTELEYRWVDMESADDYICDGTNKYKKQMKQQKCVTEEAWTNVYPYEYQKGDLIEHDSVDCGYEPSVGYHIYGTTDGHGSINISPSKEYYSSTDIVTITALPSTNYIFSCYNYGRNMAYGSVAYNSVLSLTMSHNWYVSAVFKSAAPSVGSLYYSYYNGTESWYNWSKSTLSKSDNNGKYASIIIDYSGVIQTIPNSAFSSQSYLTKIVFPNCTHIMVSAFTHCSSLTSISLPNCSYVDDFAFYSCYLLTSIDLPNCSYVGLYAFAACSSLISIDLPLCTSIGYGAFESCSSLTSISLPNCSYVGSEAFVWCSALSYVNLPLCTYVGSEAFKSCSSLTSISLPNCSYVGSEAFKSCSSLTSIDLPNCINIERFAFGDCYSLISVNAPNCAYISSYAFGFCESLTSVNLPKVTYIGDSAFYSTHIETLYMDQITSVPSGSDPFIDVSYLKSIVIPCSLVYDFTKHSIWGKYSRYYVCTGGSEESDLKEIFTSTDGGGIITLDPEGGKYYSGTTVNIGYSANPGYVFSYFQYGSTPAYGSTVLNERFSLVMSQNWYVSAAFSMNTSSGSLYYSYIDGVESWYHWSKSTLSKSDNNGKYASTIIDYDGVIKSIPSRAFSSHSYLTSIELPNCTYIGSEAFYSCYSLTNINLPNCSYISEDAFHACWGLTSINLQNCSYVGRTAFNDCPSLRSIDLPNCISIDTYAFGGCSALSSVNLPLCEYVGGGAFNNCLVLNSIDLPICSYVDGATFEYCSALQSVNLPLCTYVGDATFYSCILLKSVNLPLCTYVGKATFEYCYSLSSINLPLCSYIGSSAFFSCPILSTVSIPKCSYVGSFAFYYCKSLLSIDLPLCSHVGNDAFGGCILLTNVNLPNCLSIGVGTFEECPSLISVNLLNCSSVYYKAFFYCTALPSIDLPNCLYVDSGVFYYCNKLSIVHLPKVTYIGSSAFYSSPIETLYMDQITSVPSGGDPFAGGSVKLKSIFIPCSLVDAFTTHSIWSKYSSYFVCV